MELATCEQIEFLAFTRLGQSLGALPGRMPNKDTKDKWKQDVYREDDPWQLWKQLVRKHPSKKRNEIYSLLLRLFRSTPKLSWYRYFQKDPIAESLIREGIYAQDLWLCSASLEYLRQLLEYAKRLSAKEPLFRTCTQVSKVVITVHWERIEYLVVKARHWRFERRGFAHQVAALWVAIFRRLEDDKALMTQWISKGMQSPVWTVLAKSGSREDYMHDLIFLWKIWNKVANAKQLEYLYGVESTFVGKVFQHIAQCRDKYWILQVLKTLQYQNQRRWKHARVAMIRKSLSQSFLRTLALWSIGDGYSHPWDVNEKEEIQRLAKECIYAFIGRVSYWVETQELVNLAIQLPLEQPSHLLLIQQWLHWRPSLASYYIMRCPFHKMDPEPTCCWIFQSLALMQALATDPIGSFACYDETTEEQETIATFWDYCMHIWPLESKDSCLERILLHTTHLICPWIGFQILLHILNRLQRCLKSAVVRNETNMEEEQHKDDIALEILGRLPEFQVIWAVVRRELKQSSVVSSWSRQCMEQFLQPFHSMLYFVPMEAQHMPIELLTLGLQVVASYFEWIPWLEPRWDISKIFFARPYDDDCSKEEKKKQEIANHDEENDNNADLEYHWIVPLLKYDHLLEAVLHNIQIAMHRRRNHSFRLLVASQQGPQRLSRIGQLMYIYTLYIQEEKECFEMLATSHKSNKKQDSIRESMVSQLYICIWDIWNTSGCFDYWELHFWLYWLSWIPSRNSVQEQQQWRRQLFLQERCIAWFEQMWIELWRKPFLIWDWSKQGTRKRKCNSVSRRNHLITLAIMNKLSREEKDQQISHWFRLGVACYIRLECFVCTKKDRCTKERIEWWKDWLESNDRKELMWLKSWISNDEHSCCFDSTKWNSNVPFDDLSPPMLLDSDCWKVGLLSPNSDNVLSEEYKRRWIDHISPSPSHRLILLQTLMYYWNIFSHHSAQNRKMAIRVLELMDQVLQRISVESLKDYIHLLWSHRIWKRWLKHSLPFFVQFTEYWTNVMKKKWKTENMVAWDKYDVDRYIMPILCHWISQPDDNGDICRVVERWLSLLSVDELMMCLEKCMSCCCCCLVSAWSLQDISNRVHKCIVVLEELDTREKENNSFGEISETMKRNIEILWKKICAQKDVKEEKALVKHWERLWSAWITFGGRWLSLHNYLGNVMISGGKKHRSSSLMYLMLQLYAIKDTQHRKWRLQWIEEIWKRYPEWLGKWFRWIYHRHKKNRCHVDEECVSIAYTLLCWKQQPHWTPPTLDNYFGVDSNCRLKHRWISTVLELFYECLWREKDSFQGFHYSSDWVAIAIANIIYSSSSSSRWKGIAWRWVQRWWEKQTSCLSEQNRTLGWIALDTLNILLRDPKKEYSSLFHMMTCLLDKSAPIVLRSVQEKHCRTSDDQEETYHHPWSLFVSKYIDMIGKIFSYCIQQDEQLPLPLSIPEIQVDSPRLSISYSNQQVLPHVRTISGEKCLQWLYSIFHSWESVPDVSKHRIWTSIVKHLIFWFLDAQNRNPNENEWMQFQDWIQNRCIPWTLQLASGKEEEVFTDALSIVQCLLALMGLKKCNKKSTSSNIVRDTSTCIFLYGIPCIDKDTLQSIAQQLQKKRLGRNKDTSSNEEEEDDKWLIQNSVQHRIFSILVSIRFLWNDEASPTFPWLNQSCHSVLYRLESQRVLQTIEYICNKQGKPPSILQDTLGLLLSSGQEDENLYLVSCWIRHSFSFCGAIQMESQGSHPLDVMMETAGHREEILDPVLLLSLIFQQVSQDYCYLPQSSTQNAGDVSTTSTDHISMLIDKIHLYHNKHLMTFCIACLMVDHERIQWITRACLEYFFEMLSAPNVTKYYPQAQSMSVFINILKHSIITESPVDGFFIRFCLLLWEIFCQPTHVLYMPMVKACLDHGISMDAKFFRLVSKYVQEERITSEREESLKVAMKYREWCMSLLNKMRTKQDFERLRHVDIMEDCWRIMFGYSETKEKEPLGKRAMEEMLYGIVHFGEAELVMQVERCWGIISAIDVCWKKYPNECYCWMNIYVTLMEKWDRRMETWSQTPWLLGIDLWKSFTSRWERNEIDFDAGKHLLWRCLQVFKKCPWNIFSGWTKEWEDCWLPKLGRVAVLQWEYANWLGSTSKLIATYSSRNQLPSEIPQLIE